jgi:hypothetical protein
MQIISDHPTNESVLRTLDSILEDYSISFSERINKESPIKILSTSKHNTCRFCGRSFPAVTFNNKAHTPPELTGNKKISSIYECDSCNKDYFSKFENELANFLLPFSTLSGKKVKKNKVPKYKQTGEPVINHVHDLISISNIDDNRINRLSDNCIEIVIKIPSYIPEYVYRCLVKICLSFIPEIKLPIYELTIKWLMNLNQESNMRPGMLFSIYPNNLQLNDISLILFERKDDCIKNIPHSIFCLSYNNYTFQIYIPYCTKEKVNISLNGFPFILPTPIDLYNDSEIIRTVHVFDLSSQQRKTNESLILTIKGDQIIHELKHTKR